MRPLRIEVEGFTAFRRRVEISFEDADLFAFVGPTGAGKSSVIDAMVFALYGKVPRYQDNTAVAPVINAQSAEARVRLDFELEGEAYTAVRVVRRTKTGATTKEARLEHGAEILAGDARALDNAVAVLLGLSFEQFTKTVVLPQGEFARFLHERPADRQELLVRLLDLGVYGTMASTARERARASVDRVTLLEEESARLGGVGGATVAEHRARASDLSALAEELRDVLAEIESLDREIDDVRIVGEEQRVQQRLLQAVAVPPDVRDHQQMVDDAADRVAAAQLHVDDARRILDDALAASASVPDEVALRELVRAWDLREERAVQLAALDDGRASVLAAEAAAEAVVAEVTQQLDRADRLLAAAKDRSRAAALRHELHAGEPCPVCEQVVTDLPPPVPDHELDDARTEQRRCSAARDAARTALDDAVRARTRLDDEHARLGTELQLLDRTLHDAPTRSECQTMIDLAAASRGAEVAARKALAAAEAAHRDATRLAGRLDERARELRRELTAARDTVARLGPPAPGEVDLLADWEALVAWSTSAADEITVAIDALLVRHEDLRTRRATRREELRGACRARGVDGDTPRLLEHLAQLAARATAEADAAEERSARVEAIAAQVEALRHDQRVAEDLAKLLGASGFQQWLIEEALDELVAGASIRLNGLSSGQFSLERDGKQFAVRDHRNADELRPVKTLSGGETFLASLALALALADNVAALSASGAPRLESMFLDEGFGSLDPETLDVVAATIEELGASGRMVGVVTHIRDLADRLPVRFEVTKLPDTSTVQRVDR